VPVQSNEVMAREKEPQQWAGDGEALRHSGLKSFLRREKSTACQGAESRLASQS